MAVFYREIQITKGERGCEQKERVKEKDIGQTGRNRHTKKIKKCRERVRGKETEREGTRNMRTDQGQ